MITYTFHKHQDEDLRELGWFVFERENQTNHWMLGAMLTADLAVKRAEREPAYRQELRQEWAMAIWAEEVRAELAGAVAIEEESAARMAGRVCPDCGSVYKLGDCEICYSCMDDGDDYYGEDADLESIECSSEDE